MWLLVSCLIAADPVSDPPLAVPPAVSPSTARPLDVASFADAVLADDPLVLLLGEEHGEAASRAFGGDLVLELAQRGWLDVLVLEHPWSETRDFERRLAGGEARPHPFATVESTALLERLVDWNRTHPDQAFRIVGTDLEHGYLAVPDLDAALARVGLRRPEDAEGVARLADDPRLDPWARTLAANVAATMAARDAGDGFYGVRQERVLENLQHHIGPWAPDGERTLLWGGSWHTATAEPCSGPRFEGCWLAHERTDLAPRTHSIALQSATYSRGWLSDEALAGCSGHDYAGLQTFATLVRRNEAFAALPEGATLPGEAVRDEVVARAAAVDGPAWWADTERWTGHDWVVVFPTTPLMRPHCAH
ncbi:MAG: hypothetical protein R3F61_01505 [Myxococcota bacterium]